MCAHHSQCRDLGGVALRAGASRRTADGTGANDGRVEDAYVWKLCVGAHQRGQTLVLGVPRVAQYRWRRHVIAHAERLKVGEILQIPLCSGICINLCVASSTFILGVRLDQRCDRIHGVR